LPDAPQEPGFETRNRALNVLPREEPADRDAALPLSFTQHALRTFFLVVAGACAWAQGPLDGEREPVGLENDFLLRVWESADGTLPTHVRSIVQTRDGFVWLAAYSGIVRFDGVRAVSFSGRNTPNLPLIPQVNHAYTDTEGRLWFSSLEGRLLGRTGSAWTEYSQAAGWPGFVATAFAEWQGRLFISGESQMVEGANGKFTNVVPPQLPPDFVPPLKVIADGAGNLWLTSPSHAWMREGASWKLMASASRFGSPIRGSAPARNGGIWVATERELRKLPDTGASIPRQRPEDFRGDTVEILDDSRGNLWVGGANSGLRVWMRDGRVVAVGAKADGLEPRITSLIEDREGNILVGTGGAGLARFKPRPITMWLGQMGSLAGTIVNSVCEGATGDIFIATEGSGLRLVRNGRLPVPVTSADGALGAMTHVTSLLRLRDGTVIAAVDNKGLFRIEGETALPVPCEPLGKQRVRSLFEDSRGRLWIGSEGGIIVRAGDRSDRFPASGASPLHDVCAIAEDTQGTLWFIGQEGLARATAAGIEPASLPGIPKGANLLSLHTDREGALWVGVESQGLLRVKGGAGFLFTEKQGMPFLSIGAFIEDGQDLWLSGEKGLVRVKRVSFEEVAAGRSAQLELQHFNRADGLPSDACRRGYQPSACRSANGRLWFATHKGAVSAQTGEIVQAVYEPRAVIEEVVADGLPVPIDAAGAGEVRIPPGARHLTIRCAHPTLGKPEYVRFQYRLDGLDSLWHDVGSERVMRFYDLQPGSYRFLIRAIGTDGRFVEPPTSMAFLVQPAYWQTAWFRGLCAGALILLAGGVAWRMQRDRLARAAEKLREQEERARLEAQLQQSQKMEAIGRLAGGIAHDFNNLLTSVIGGADLLRTDLATNPESQQIALDILSAGGRARELVSQILTFSRQRPAERRVIDLAPAFHESLRLLRTGIPATIEMRIDVPEALPPVLADVAQIQRIIMNLGANAAQAVEGNGGRIVIAADEFTADNSFVREHPKARPIRYVRVAVQDNGHGMDEPTMRKIFDPFFTTKDVGKGTGLGLAVVHGIVEQHEGIIEVDSAPGAGTTFRVYLPISDASFEPPTPRTLRLRPGSGQLIMVVDDEEAVMKVAKAMLEKLSYRVETHNGSQSALDAFTADPEKFTVVITDFSMPGRDGVSLARHMWELRPDIPIILYSGYGGQITPDDARAMGFVQMLSKPFQMQALNDAVVRALRRAKAARGTGAAPATGEGMKSR
jgi:signal transduction histidine kinase/ligand-binding sensor domain-containing protein/CheY-like chemotaxis protein